MVCPAPPPLVPNDLQETILGSTHAMVRETETEQWLQQQPILCQTSNMMHKTLSRTVSSHGDMN